MKSAEEKIKIYEQFLHNISICFTCHDNEGIRQLLKNADDWSYAHRVGNGELTDDEQQSIIEKKLNKLNNFSK